MNKMDNQDFLQNLTKNGTTPVRVMSPSGTWVTSFAGGGGGVTSLNTLTGAVDIVGAGNVSISVAGQNVVVSGTGDGAGDVVGPGSSTDKAIAIWSGTSGTFLQDSAYTIDGGLLSTVGTGTISGANINIFATNDVQITGGADGGTGKVRIDSTGGFVTFNTPLVAPAVDKGTSLGVGNDAFDEIYGYTVYQSGAQVISSGVGLGSVTVTKLPSGILQISGAASSSSSSPSTNITFMMDNGSAVLPSGYQGYITVPTSGTISAWTLLGNVSGAMTMDVYRTTYAAWNTASGQAVASNSICFTDRPLIAATNSKNRNTAVTVWSGLAAQDILMFGISGTVTNITNATLNLTFTPTS